MLSPQIKPIIDIDMLYFIRNSVFDICVQACKINQIGANNS